MQCYAELIPPTAVTHAVSLSFVTPDELNLVVAKTSLLQVFKLTNSSTKCLSLIGEYPLSGTVTALAPIKALETQAGGEALLVSFKDAKVSLIEWDAVNHRTSTTSIHYYEGENVTGQPFGPRLHECQSVLTVDPNSRCAAMKFGVRHLAILPFRQLGDEMGEGGDDGELNMDATPISSGLKKANTGMTERGDDLAKSTPYKASFVLPLTILDPMLCHPVHLAFLHEYREPTFGVLAAAVQTSTSLLDERKDALTYSVFALDLDQRASTNLVAVSKLPSDLWKILPLALPIGGALLIGTNELIHVDQSGKTNALAVNEFAKASSNLSLKDQSDLAMKLEHCQIMALDPGVGDFLIILQDGSMAILKITLTGRSVSGLSVSRVISENGGALLGARSSCVASFDNNRIFIGSEGAESLVIQWTKQTAPSKKRTHKEMLDGDADAGEDEEEDDDDDLYAPELNGSKRRPSSISVDAASRYRFDRHDAMPALGEMRDVCFGRSSSTTERLAMVAGVGTGHGSRLAMMSQSISPRVTFKTSFEKIKNAWAFSTPTTDSSDSKMVDTTIFVSDGQNTNVYDVQNTEDNPDASPRYQSRVDTEFERDGDTICVGMLANNSQVLQCRKSEIRIYDAVTLSLNQILPMADDETDAELKIVHASFCDPFGLVLRDDSSVLVLRLDTAGEVEPAELKGSINDRVWLSACLFAGDLTGGEVCVFALAQDGSLCIFSGPEFNRVYTAPMLSHLPAVLSQDAPQRRVGAKETLTEILVTDLGPEGSLRTYLVLRNNLDDLTIYEPFRPAAATTASTIWVQGLRFRKVPFRYFPKYDETPATGDAESPAPMSSFRFGHHSVVCIPGPSPTLIVREGYSLPHAFPLHSGTKLTSLTPIHTPGCPYGLFIGDVDGNVGEHALPSNLEYGTGFAVERLALGDPAQEVRHVAFHEDRGMYVVTTCSDVDFVFPADDGRRQEEDACSNEDYLGPCFIPRETSGPSEPLGAKSVEKGLDIAADWIVCTGSANISLRPQVPQHTIHLLSAEKRNVIHTLRMPYLETVTCMKIMPLEVSEHTHEQRLMVVVGTAVQRGEDLPTTGAVSIFDVLDVVPEPGKEDSGYKLSLVAREETRGAVTVVEPFQTGFIGTAQGQKLMIRGLKEDGSCLPVAFIDAQCHTVQLKTLGSSGLWLAADAQKGLWFGGFTEEPYNLCVLGKSKAQMEVLTAEFLPFDGSLYLLVIDADENLHGLQYDPEDSKSLSGTKLLHRGAFHVGHFATSMRLLPSTLAANAVQQALVNDRVDSEDQKQTETLYQVITTNLSGAVGLITPVDESTYRRLGALQAHLTSVLEHPAGLNPRSHRGVAGEVSTGITLLDGEIIRRIGELSSSRRVEVLGRAGMDVWTLRSDLEVIGGEGLGYV